MSAAEADDMVGAATTSALAMTDAPAAATTAPAAATAASNGTEIAAVLDFWFGPPGSPLRDGSRPEWFRKDRPFDASIRVRFAPLIERGLRGELEGWAATPEGALAQVVVLDQFTRNVFRDTPRAFAGDARALATASALVGQRHDEALTPWQRSFAYLPFEHAESLAMQEEALRLYDRLASAAPETGGLVEYAKRHHAIVERFGRFPHRNRILGRQSTAEETDFLQTPGSSF